MRCSNSLSSTLTWSVATVSATLLSSAALAQDECTSAVNVTAGVPAPFDTSNATPSSNPAPDDSQCPGTYLSWGTANPDVWFRFVAPETGLVDFSTCLASSFDTSMVIYKGSSCSSLTQVACNGDGEGEGGCQDYWSRVVGLSAQPGEVFYIRIGGYTGAAGTDSGPGALTVTFTAVAAGCATATGECDEAHGGLGCVDPACCTAVCTVNPLCCDIAWDAGCVEVGVELCGFYVYQCIPGGPANNCATNATVVTASGTRQFNSAGATTDGPAHSGDTCQSGNDFFFNDLWWRIPVAANGALVISTCGTTPYDNKLAVYDMGTTPSSYDFNTLPDTLVGCNDDGAGGACFLTDGTTPYASAMTVNVEAGRTYLVRMGSFTEGQTGSGSIAFTVPTPCVLDTPTIFEGEACGSSLNNGCNAAGEAENIQLGATVAGTFWADNDTRDTDFYRLSIASDTQVTVSVKSASFATVLILGGDLSVPECDGISVISAATGACPATTTACLKTGEYFIFVGTAAATGGGGFNGNPCGNGVFNNYTLKVTGSPAECPVILGTTCDDPGPDSRQLSEAATTTGNFVQGCATGCGNLSGGNADTQFAVKIGGGNLLKEISCVSFGVAALRSVTPTGQACGYGASDLLIPCEVALYRDLDGGDPRNFIEFAGDGNDLELIESFNVLLPSGVYMGTLQPDEPICVENETNLVFVLKTPNLFQGPVEGVPAGAGYRAGIGVAIPPAGGFATFNVFGRYTLCTGAGQGVFTPFGVGATGAISYQWPVSINGTAGGCSGGGNDCPADLDGNGVINGFDLSAVLAGWGTPAGDTNGDGTTNGIDITTILSAWNTNCP